jgi:hypothetical protein
MKNSTSDLNDLLFAELERLGNIAIDNDAALDKEINRAKAVTAVAMAIIANGNLVVKANEFTDGSFCKIRLPEFLGATAGSEPSKKLTPLLLKKNA